MNFRKYLLLLLVVVSFSSCSRFTQVVYVSPTHDDIRSVDHFYQYENDDVKVVYWFWAEHGIMSFFVWNKTDHPLYIDWKKSAMINNGKKLAYYTSEGNTNFRDFGKNYGHRWIDIFNHYNSKSDFRASLETVVKDEQVSFIPPRSYISNAFYNLTANVYFDVSDRNTDEETINFCKVYVSRSNHDIIFRNYLTYSASEHFENEEHIDNEFRLNKVVTMDNRLFGFRDVDGNDQNDWERPTRFYITNLSWKDVYK